MQYLKGVSSLAIEEEFCTGCGFCIQVCPHAVIALEDRKAFVRERDACMECGACKRNCPFGAISVEAGVGCANAILRGMLTGRETTCGCSCDGTSASGSECC